MIHTVIVMRLNKKDGKLRGHGEKKEPSTLESSLSVLFMESQN